MLRAQKIRAQKGIPVPRVSRPKRPQRRGCPSRPARRLRRTSCVRRGCLQVRCPAGRLPWVLAQPGGRGIYGSGLICRPGAPLAAPPWGLCYGSGDHSPEHSDTETHAHTRSHTLTRTHTHTHPHTRTHTHTHTHTHGSTLGVAMCQMMVDGMLRRGPWGTRRSRYAWDLQQRATKVH